MTICGGSTDLLSKVFDNSSIAASEFCRFPENSNNLEEYVFKYVHWYHSVVVL